MADLKRDFWIVVLRTDPDLLYTVVQVICKPSGIGQILVDHDLFYYAIFQNQQRAKDYAAEMNYKQGNAHVELYKGAC